VDVQLQFVVLHKFTRTRDTILHQGSIKVTLSWKLADPRWLLEDLLQSLRPVKRPGLELREGEPTTTSVDASLTDGHHQKKLGGKRKRASAEGHERSRTRRSAGARENQAPKHTSEGSRSTQQKKRRWRRPDRSV